MRRKPKLAIVRGKFLNQYEMQFYYPLINKYDITAFGSLASFHDAFAFPTIKLPSPMDLPEFPYKMPLLNRIFLDAQYLFGLERSLIGFDLVHTAETYYHYTQQCLNAKRKGYVKKVIATVLENIPFNNEGIWGRKGFKKQARDKLDHIIALTDRTRDALVLEGADSQKITVVSHAIDTKNFSPRKDFLKRQAKNKKIFSILFAGRLEIYKGVQEALYASKLLLQDKALKGYNLTFTFIGCGSEKKNMQDLEKKLGLNKHIIHKQVSYRSMPEEYKKADLFWAPSKPVKSYQEQYCTALLEAQAAGLPIVTTFSGGIPENVGDAGVIVGPGDFYSLKEAMKDFILSSQKRVYFAKKARERAQTIHDVHVVAKQIVKVYEKVLGEA